MLRAKPIARMPHAEYLERERSSTTKHEYLRGEVFAISDSSEADDRGEKFARYRRLASLQEYVLVSQREPRIEVFRRTAEGRWELGEAVAGGRILLESIGVELVVDDVYANALAS